MRDGAHDFIEKPFSADKLIATTRRAIEQRKLVLENRSLKSQIQLDNEWGIIGHSAAIREVRRQVTALASSRVDVLIHGETGTGKEVVARAIHLASRCKGPFVAINCGALPEAIFESEVFGHESGAFTGAVKRRIGKLEHAQQGTVLLDELESMPLALQAKLLRTIQERTVERLGSNEAVPIDCRFVAATKVDLFEASKRGLFREDLYFRLEVATMTLPPLRSRVEDIPLLFGHFVLRAAGRHGVDPPPWTEQEMLEWQQKDWPGNVRELRNLAERWSLGLARAGAVSHRSRESLNETLGRVERTLVEAALRDHAGNVVGPQSSWGFRERRSTTRCIASISMERSFAGDLAFRGDRTLACQSMVEVLSQ